MMAARVQIQVRPEEGITFNYSDDSSILVVKLSPEDVLETSDWSELNDRTEEEVAANIRKMSKETKELYEKWGLTIGESYVFFDAVVKYTSLEKYLSPSEVGDSFMYSIDEGD